MRIRYLGRLLSLRPETVLDVGAGLGHVLSGLRSAGIRAKGLESSPERVAALTQLGFEAQLASAEALPFETDAVDWVSLRHVLHHLADPVTALCEAARVARVGILVAEPWRNLDLPGQELGLALDEWLKRQDRRLGREHHADIAPARIAADLESCGSFRFEYETHLMGTGAPLGEFAQDLDERLAGLGDDHPDRVALDEILEQARDRDIGLTGSALVVANAQ